jgi:hypothetical protein
VKATVENYERTYERPVHTNYRMQVQVQWPGETMSWRLHHGFGRTISPDNTEALAMAVKVQQEHPDWNVRLMVYRETEYLSEPVHPAMIRVMAGAKT